jgi:hypothetical protein
MGGCGHTGFSNTSMSDEGLRHFYGIVNELFQHGASLKKAK